jgi:hypothetical protein
MNEDRLIKVAPSYTPDSIVSCLDRARTTFELNCPCVLRIDCEIFRHCPTLWSHKMVLPKFMRCESPLLASKESWKNIILFLQLYWTAFDKCEHYVQNLLKILNLLPRFRRYPPINNVVENDAFCQFLHATLDEQCVSFVWIYYIPSCLWDCKCGGHPKPVTWSVPLVTSPSPGTA